VERSSGVLLPPELLSQAKLLYATAAAPLHDFPGHAECAARVPAIISAIQDFGVCSASRPQQVQQLTGFSAATPEIVAAVHDRRCARMVVGCMTADALAWWWGA
jgi:hypothetical protein